MDEIENTGFTDEQSPEEPEQELQWDLDDTPDDSPKTVPEPEKYKLLHLGEEVEVTREEVIALAQKGRDYDRIRERLVRLESGDAPKSGTLVRDVHDFVSMYGGKVPPETIPVEVWTDVRAGIPLVVAYQRFENRSLRGQLKTYDNRTRAARAVTSAGEGGGEGSIESNWYSD